MYNPVLLTFQLKEYINRLTRKVIEVGNLDGLLITGQWDLFIESDDSEEA